MQGRLSTVGYYSDKIFHCVGSTSIKIINQLAKFNNVVAMCGKGGGLTLNPPALVVIINHFESTPKMTGCEKVVYLLNPTGWLNLILSKAGNVGQVSGAFITGLAQYTLNASLPKTMDEKAALRKTRHLFSGGQQ